MSAEKLLAEIKRQREKIRRPKAPKKTEMVPQEMKVIKMVPAPKNSVLPVALRNG
jgi:hypothetical protein